MRQRFTEGRGVNVPSLGQIGRPPNDLALGDVSAAAASWNAAFGCNGGWNSRPAACVQGKHLLCCLMVSGLSEMEHNDEVRLSRYSRQLTRDLACSSPVVVGIQFDNWSREAALRGAIEAHGCDPHRQ